MIDVQTETELRFKLRLGTVYWLERRPDKAIEHLESVRPMFEEAEPLMKAMFHNNLGLAYQLKAEVSGDADYYRLAFAEYETVKRYLLHVDDLPAIGVVETNIAVLSLSLRRTEQAHAHINVAIEIFTEFSGHTYLGQAYETQTRIYLAEKNLRQAEISITKSVELLQAGEEAWPLTEALKTLDQVIEACKHSAVVQK